VAVEHEVGEIPSVTLEPTSCPPHRFPPAIISHAVSLCHIFSLSLRELTCAERGILVTHESIRLGCLKGAIFAKRLRSRRPQPGDTWHLDEVFIRTQGARTICAP
jgi:putative transposase